MSTSYKPALLKALIRIVRERPAPEIPLLRIGAEFVKLYWVQTVMFHLRQAATLRSEPEVVRSIRNVADVHRVRLLANLPDEARLRLERDMARILRINVLEAFHRSKPDGMAPLFSRLVGSDFVVLPVGAVQFIAAHSSALESIANLWWARYLEKVNLLAPLVIEKVERNGAQRGSLSRYLRILREIDEPRCFYCGRDLGSVTVEVDHVIPWSFLLADPLWDLVLACAPCNGAKSDTLPAPEFVERLVATGARRSRISLPPGFASAFLGRDDIDRYYNAALAVEWPSGWSPPAGSMLGA